MNGSPSSPPDVLLSWSGGKDSAMALHELRRGGRYRIAALLTTLADPYRRISHHGVPLELLERQAAALDLPLRKVYVPAGCTNERYEAILRAALLRFRRAGVRTVAFGDIFLSDVRRRRQRLLRGLSMRGLFPLWRRDTGELARAFIGAGFRARIACADLRRLDGSFVGRSFDRALLRDLPPGVDPCGENGEFHSFVWDGPPFRRPVMLRPGRHVDRDCRRFIDLLPDDGPRSSGAPRPAPSADPHTQPSS